MGKPRPILYAIEKYPNLHGKTMYNFFLGLLLKKRGQIYLDLKLVEIKVSNLIVNTFWPNSLEELPT